MFEKGLDQVWHKVDEENTGKVSPDKVVEIVKLGLEQAGKAEYFKEEMIKEAL
jgi:hypothetical protein